MPFVSVRGVPDWVEHTRLLDDGPWEREGDAWVGKRSARDAADLQARLRNLGMGGHPITVDVRPSLKRTVVRSARSEEARRQRHTTTGFDDARARVDDDGRIYLTPEALALQVARNWPAEHVLDLTCGCGGNAIAFAREGARVTAIDTSAERLALAGHNARLYGVEDRIELIHDDALNHLNRAADLVFLDPPWGQVDRISCTRLPLLDEVLAQVTGPVLAKLPPSFYRPHLQLRAWFGLAEGDRRRVKFVTAYRPA